MKNKTSNYFDSIIPMIIVCYTAIALQCIKNVLLMENVISATDYMTDYIAFCLYFLILFLVLRIFIRQNFIFLMGLSGVIALIVVAIFEQGQSTMTGSGFTKTANLRVLYLPFLLAGCAGIIAICYLFLKTMLEDYPKMKKIVYFLIVFAVASFIILPYISMFVKSNIEDFLRIVMLISICIPPILLFLIIIYSWIYCAKNTEAVLAELRKKEYGSFLMDFYAYIRRWKK